MNSNAVVPMQNSVAARIASSVSAGMANSLPASEWATRTGLILPMYPALEEEAVRRVADALTEALGQANAPSRGAA